MSKGIYKGQRFVQTRDTKKASAIVSMGVKPFPARPVQKIKDIENGYEFIVWAFNPKSECGRWDTLKLLKWFNDEEWFEENQDHPYAYAIASIKNREALLDIINDIRGTLRFKKDDQTWYIPENGGMHKTLYEEGAILDLPPVEEDFDGIQP